MQNCPKIRKPPRNQKTTPKCFYGYAYGSIQVWQHDHPVQGINISAEEYQHSP